MANTLERDIAIQAVIKSCEFSNYLKSSIPSTNHLVKQNDSPVTIADFGSQIIIINELLSSFPYDNIISEEKLNLLDLHEYADFKTILIKTLKTVFSSMNEDRINYIIEYNTQSNCNVNKFWVLDPIDGTKGYIRNSQYAIALSLIEKGKIKLGVLCCPNLEVKSNATINAICRGSIFIAERDQGAFNLNLKKSMIQKVHVNKISSPEKAVFCESLEGSHTSHEIHKKIASVLGIKNPPIRIDSQCKYALLARGDSSIYLRFPKKNGHYEYIWDHAAGSIIVEEAGGRVTDFSGNSLDFSAGIRLSKNYGLIATNGLLHTEVLNAAQNALNKKSADSKCIS